MREGKEGDSVALASQLEVSHGFLARGSFAVFCAVARFKAPYDSNV